MVSQGIDQYFFIWAQLEWKQLESITDVDLPTYMNMIADCCASSVLCKFIPFLFYIPEVHNSSWLLVLEYTRVRDNSENQPTLKE